MTTALETIKSAIDGNDVVLFMKGTQNFPQCGFSARAVQLLQPLGKIYAVDVMKEPAVRDGIKVYSNWPTIPQLYIAGEFMGGSDIMTEMYEAGDLQKCIDLLAGATD